MQGWEIAVLIIFILLILTGIGLGIYFVWKHDQDQKKQNPSGGGTGPSRPSGPSGPSGPTGPTGPTVPGNFSISPQANPRVYLTFGSGTTQAVPTIITSNLTTTKCVNYSWQNIPNFINNGINVTSALVSNAPPNTIIGFSPNGGPGFIIPGPNKTLVLNQITDLNESLIYNPTAKTWCGGVGAIGQTKCMYYNSDGSVTLEDTGIAANTPANFIWNNITPIVSPLCTT